MARRKKKQPPNPTMGEKKRLNLKLDAGLAAWAFEYALLQNTSVTHLITSFLEDLRRHHEDQLDKDAEQI
jgi:hypothetical protein